MTIAEIAQDLGYSPRTIKRWADAGEFPITTLPGGRIRIRRDDYARWLDDRTTQNLAS